MGDEKCAAFSMRAIYFLLMLDHSSRLISIIEWETDACSLLCIILAYGYVVLGVD
jgi:hypothetical protein